MSDSQSSRLNDLLQMDIVEIQEWLKVAFEDPQSETSGFNWLGLADAAAFKATSATISGETSLSLSWARVAIAAYQYLINLSDIAGQESYLNSFMNLRVFMITILGSVAGDPVLDIDEIVNWFFQAMSLPYSQVVKKSAIWGKLTRDEILELRQIKNRISIIEPLAKDARFNLSQELIGWVALREKFP